MPAITRRPKRWDHPFDPGMSEDDVSELMTHEPWKGLAAWAHAELPEATAEARVGDLRRHLLNDARLRTCQAGELVIRVGDYGNSAFVVLGGSVRVVLGAGGHGLGAAAERKFDLPRRGFLRSLAQVWARRREPEERPPPRGDAPAPAATSQGPEDYVPILLDDVPGVIERERTARIGAGGLFGEIASLGRTPRTATIFVEEEGTLLLEIRWQGLRDIRRKFPPYKRYVDDRFRERVLMQVLRGSPWFERVGDTREVRRLLVHDGIREVFVEALGLGPASGEEVRLPVDDGDVRLTPLAEARGWAGNAGILVYQADGAGGPAWGGAKARTGILRMCTESERKVVVVQAERGVRHWLWCMAEPEEAGPADVKEVRENGARGTHELCQRLLHEIGLHEIGRQTSFDSFGAVDQTQLARSGGPEPAIVEEGHYPDGLWLVRAGSVRVSRLVNGLERTLSYLGPGQTYGLAELAHNWRHPERHVAMRHTLRARGYVDTLLVPASVVTRFVLPSIPEDRLPPPFEEETGEPMDPVTLIGGVGGVDRRMVEFLVDHAFVNGTQAMLIDLERCTRCDDCVRACAQGHGQNPRFVRHGPVHAGYMVANACMHCNDPVCMIGCPTGAISRESATGLVAINDPTCIGCATCANNCPYDNIRMVRSRTHEGTFTIDAKNEPHQKATKCDLCVTQVGGPACQRACPHDALQRVNLADAGKLAGWLRR